MSLFMTHYTRKAELSTETCKPSGTFSTICFCAGRPLSPAENDLSPESFGANADKLADCRAGFRRRMTLDWWGALNQMTKRFLCRQQAFFTRPVCRL